MRCRPIIEGDFQRSLTSASAKSRSYPAVAKLSALFFVLSVIRLRSSAAAPGR